jgi:peptidoglycan/xylan/chitin deacetylase (PgdA/CDA1 family)
MNIIHKIKRFKQFAANVVANCREAPVIVLLYHRVCKIENDSQKLAVCPENFESQIKFLSNNYPILRFEEAYKHNNKMSFVITFDDGYYDNFYNALPILKKHSVPATFFVASNNIQSGERFWWDKLEEVILSSKLDLADLNLPFPIPSCREDAVVQVQLFLKSFAVEERDKIINRLIDESNTTLTDDNRPMTIAELKELDSEGLVTIGSHTVNHPQLAALSEEDQKLEIASGKEQLEKILGHSVDTFSYPFGNINDFSNVTVKACKQAGIKKAAANFPGQLHSWSDSFNIPRHLVRNWNLNEFKKQIFRFKFL